MRGRDTTAECVLAQAPPRITMAPTAAPPKAIPLKAPPPIATSAPMAPLSPFCKFGPIAIAKSGEPNILRED